MLCSPMTDILQLNWDGNNNCVFFENAFWKCSSYYFRPLVVFVPPSPRNESEWQPDCFHWVSLYFLTLRSQLGMLSSINNEFFFQACSIQVCWFPSKWMMSGRSVLIACRHIITRVMDVFVCSVGVELASRVLIMKLHFETSSFHCTFWRLCNLCYFGSFALRLFGTGFHNLLTLCNEPL
jgi:hypothetical protein